MDVAAYLARIRLAGPIEPTLDNLEMLQRAHLTWVPFENLHVFHRRGVETTPEWSVPKIVDRGRGGWCFELNGAFGTLLEALGYSVTRLGAEVLFGNVAAFPVPDHLTLRVQLERPYLIDVGFGDSFTKPLPLDSEGPHDGGIGMYGFAFDGDETTLLAFEDDGTAVPQFRFDPTPRVPADFDQSSRRLQTQPTSRWTETPFATRLLDGGPDRVTLLRDRIKFRREGQWTEEPITAAEFPGLLARWFDLTP
ncbi:MAG TPA: arylamine N-acetyltransferase [Acidimicrobiia bacterium]|jgi:N-hydroxyarylamine O-acetyltransferase